MAAAAAADLIKGFARASVVLKEVRDPTYYGMSWSLSCHYFVGSDPKNPYKCCLSNSRNIGDDVVFDSWSGSGLTLVEAAAKAASWVSLENAQEVEKPVQTNITIIADELLKKGFHLSAWAGQRDELTVYLHSTHPDTQTTYSQQGTGPDLDAALLEAIKAKHMISSAKAAV